MTYGILQGLSDERKGAQLLVLLPGISLTLGVSYGSCMAHMFGVERGNRYHISMSGNGGPFGSLQRTHSLSSLFNLKQKLNVILSLSTIWKGYEVQGPHLVWGNCIV